MRRFSMVLALSLILAACGDDGPQRSYDDLFADVQEHYCGDPPDTECRTTLISIFGLRGLESKFSPEDLLEEMLALDVDEWPDPTSAWLKANITLALDK